MVHPGKHMVSKRLAAYETVAFLAMILTVWLDEILDLPHLLFGVPQTPINWIEATLESFLIAIIGGVIIYHTHSLFKQMKYLEGIIPVCSSCKRIRDEKDQWQQIEAYIRDRSDAEFSHGICPECARKLYPEYYKK